MPELQIQDTRLTAVTDPRDGDGFMVKSIPRPYRVDWLTRTPLRQAIETIVAQAPHPLLLLDRRVRELHLEGSPALKAPTLEVDSSESLKTLDGALELWEFLDRNKATKASMLFVIGGGIVQDVAGFGCAIYKRGIPWTYIPSTFLGQGDSGMGGKAGLNYKGSKNILALFSAPRRVVIHAGFLETLPEEDVLSGLGEVFRLHVTGGPEFLSIYERGFARFAAGDRGVLDELLVSALAVKRAVIEEDEFELDIRRAMNYGHSIGHALEALTRNAIPHGTAVVVGMMVENELSHRQGGLKAQDRDRLAQSARPLVTQRVLDVLRNVDMSGILEVLRRDKKSEGTVLKLALLQAPGEIRFVNISLEPEIVDLIRDALGAVIVQLAA